MSVNICVCIFWWGNSLKFINKLKQKTNFNSNVFAKKQSNSIFSNIINTLPIILILASPLALTSCNKDTSKDETQAQKDTDPNNYNSVPIQISGKLEQSATFVGKTVPFSEVDAAGVKTNADKDGYFVFGVDRDAPSTAIISVTTPEGHTGKTTLYIKKKKYDIRTIRGLPPATVTPPAADLAKIQNDSELKQVGFDSQDAKSHGFLQSFRWPLDDFVVTSNWGAQRVLNGTLSLPHYGVDLAAPIGTPVYAPADGKIVIAKKGMHYEGGMIAIDHGQGLISEYFHMSKITARAGQYITKGQKIGEVGEEGRATGPHLCWRMRWRGRQLDPREMMGHLPVVVQD